MGVQSYTKLTFEIRVERNMIYNFIQPWVNVFFAHFCCRIQVISLRSSLEEIDEWSCQESRVTIAIDDNAIGIFFIVDKVEYLCLFFKVNSLRESLRFLKWGLQQLLAPLAKKWITLQPNDLNNIGRSRRFPDGHIFQDRLDPIYLR